MKLLDRKILKEKKSELKENVRGKPYHKTIVPKLRFLKEVLKLVFADIKSNRPFQSKKSEAYSKEIETKQES